MDHSLANELYSESLQLSNVELGSTSTANTKQFDSHDFDEDDPWYEDGSSWNDSIEDLDKASDLDREWQRRRDQFHTLGYRNGVMKGKEAAMQEGFNIGFKESVYAGFNWGLVRGITSAMTCLSDELKVRLVETQEKRNKFQGLYECAHSLSTADALKLFHRDILTEKSVKQHEDAEPNSYKADLQDQSSDGSLLRNCYGQLQSLLECSEIKVHLEIDQ
ncbi:uncharacterized protein LOC132299403 [Cornus florida]|uniref:uncharacterized protein LOC132299403 n=1 Tax=Cornus florida TaxID=4283 RepID=UPI0028A1E836|nr:uncharacterized protein LOC132299403 [Cornus florida]XP_059651953.1 uncharacterized protein LOC132299403 [Cornus florida]